MARRILVWLTLLGFSAQAVGCAPLRHAVRHNAADPQVDRAVFYGPQEPAGIPANESTSVKTPPKPTQADQRSHRHWSRKKLRRRLRRDVGRVENAAREGAEQLKRGLIFTGLVALVLGLVYLEMTEDDDC